MAAKSGLRSFEQLIQDRNSPTVPFQLQFFDRHFAGCIGCFWCRTTFGVDLGTSAPSPWNKTWCTWQLKQASSLAKTSTTLLNFFYRKRKLMKLGGFKTCGISFAKSHMCKLRIKTSLLVSFRIAMIRPSFFITTWRTTCNHRLANIAWLKMGISPKFEFE